MRLFMDSFWKSPFGCSFDCFVERKVYRSAEWFAGRARVFYEACKAPGVTLTHFEFDSNLLSSRFMSSQLDLRVIADTLAELGDACSAVKKDRDDANHRGAEWAVPLYHPFSKVSTKLTSALEANTFLQEQLETALNELSLFKEAFPQGAASAAAFASGPTDSEFIAAAKALKAAVGAAESVERVRLRKSSEALLAEVFSAVPALNASQLP